MVGVHKHIRGDRGTTGVGLLPRWPFRLERRRSGWVALVYHQPFTAFVDEIRAEAAGSWLGRSNLAGLELGRIRVVRPGSKLSSLNVRAG